MCQTSEHEKISAAGVFSVRPCPFCNSKKLVVIRLLSGSKWRVKCKSCQTLGPIFKKPKRVTWQAAIALWNPRSLAFSEPVNLQVKVERTIG